MLDSENMSEAARNALVHSGIDDGNEDDVLAHYGVEGMHWGVRNSDRKNPSRRAMNRAATKAGTNVVKTIRTPRGHAVATVRKRISPLEYAVGKSKARGEHQKELKKAYDKAFSVNDFDFHSKKAKRLHKAQVNTALAGVGALGISLLAKNPKTKAGAAAVAIALNTTSLLIGTKSHRESDKNVYDKYGK